MILKFMTDFILQFSSSSSYFSLPLLLLLLLLLLLVVVVVVDNVRLIAVSCVVLYIEILHCRLCMFSYLLCERDLK